MHHQQQVGPDLFLNSFCCSVRRFGKCGSWEYCQDVAMGISARLKLAGQPIIMHELVQNQKAFSDLDNPMSYNIQVFKGLLEQQES